MNKEHRRWLLEHGFKKITYFPDDQIYGHDGMEEVAIECSNVDEIFQASIFGPTVVGGWHDSPQEALASLQTELKYKNAKIVAIMQGIEKTLAEEGAQINEDGNRKIEK